MIICQKIGNVSDGFLELPALVNVRVISLSHSLKLVVLSRQIVSLSVFGEDVVYGLKSDEI